MICHGSKSLRCVEIFVSAVPEPSPFMFDDIIFMGKKMWNPGSKIEKTNQHHPQYAPNQNRSCDCKNMLQIPDPHESHIISYWFGQFEVQLLG